MNPKKYLLLIATLFIATSSIVLAGRLDDLVEEGNIRLVEQHLSEVGGLLTQKELKAAYDKAHSESKYDIAKLIVEKLNALRIIVLDANETGNIQLVKDYLNEAPFLDKEDLEYEFGVALQLQNYEIAGLIYAKFESLYVD